MKETLTGEEVKLLVEGAEIEMPDAERPKAAAPEQREPAAAERPAKARHGRPPEALADRALRTE